MPDCCMLHLELVAGLFGVAHAHGLWVEDIDLEEFAGHQLLKPVQVPSPLHFTRFHQSSAFIDLGDSYCNTIDVAYGNCSNDDIQWLQYSSMYIIHFNSLAILTQDQTPLRHTLNFPILPHHPPSAPRSWSKSNPVDGFAFA